MPEHYFLVAPYFESIKSCCNGAKHWRSRVLLNSFTALMGKLELSRLVDKPVLIKGGGSKPYLNEFVKQESLDVSRE